MSELFLTFVLLGIIILVQFLVLDSHIAQIEMKIYKLEEKINELKEGKDVQDNIHH